MVFAGFLVRLSRGNKPTEGRTFVFKHLLQASRDLEPGRSGFCGRGISPSPLFLSPPALPFSGGKVFGNVHHKSLPTHLRELFPTRGRFSFAWGRPSVPRFRTTRFSGVWAMLILRGLSGTALFRPYLLWASTAAEHHDFFFPSAFHLVRGLNGTRNKLESRPLGGTSSPKPMPGMFSHPFVTHANRVGL